MRSQTTLKVAALAAAGLAGILVAASSVAQSSSAGAIVSAEPAATPAHHLLTDEWVVNVGAYVLATNLDGSLNGTATSGTNVSHDVNFDQAFGTNADATRVRADVLWRFLPRHHVRFLYFDNDVSRTRTLDRDIAWGDYTFKAQGEATARNKFTVYELAYEYAFMRESNYEVVGSAGVHYVDMTLQLSGQATVTAPDGTTSPTQSFESKTSSLPAPLPVLGLRGGWAVSPHWYLDASGQVFKVKVGAYDGNWWDLRADATWMYNRHFGIGAGWNKFTTHVDVDKTNFQGRINVGYSGLLVFLTGSF